MSAWPWFILSGAIGWVGGSYTYSQLPPHFKHERPLFAAVMVGGVCGLVLPAVLALLVRLTSKCPPTKSRRDVYGVGHLLGEVEAFEHAIERGSPGSIVTRVERRWLWRWRGCLAAQ
jgi:hypothetical protein